MAINKKDIGKTGSVRYSNVSSDEIQITEDKLKLKLEHFVSDIKRINEWLAWFGLFLSTLFTLVTSDFHDFWGISSTFFQNVCLIVCLGAFAMTCHKIYIYWKTDLSVDNFINDCKNVE